MRYKPLNQFAPLTVKVLFNYVLARFSLLDSKLEILTPRPEIHRKKVMLCVWWDMKGIINYDLLDPKQTVTANLYSQQFIRLSDVLEKKRPFGGKGKRNVILLHDNA